MRARAQQAALPGTTATASLVVLVALPRAPVSSRIWRMHSIQSESSSILSGKHTRGMQAGLQLKVACRGVLSKQPPWAASNYSWEVF